jgi:uncharacterized protein YciI
MTKVLVAMAEHRILFYDYVDDVLDRRPPHREAHLERVRTERDAGRIVMAGALGDPPRSGLIVFRVDDPAQVRAFVDEDPYVANGLVTDWRVDPWNVVT